MSGDTKKVRALCLLSGGLDSILAVKMLLEQGVSVTGFTCTTPFFGATNAEYGAIDLGIELVVLDITDEHLKMLKHPPHGYGKQMNPCIDCHAMMFRRAGEYAIKNGYDFLATGEVLNERPMSQNRQSLDVVARDSGFEDILLRPLSAQLLPPTKPEREGLVDRERLGSIEGRSRLPQMELAKKYRITNYQQPAGGCLLTDPNFSKKLRELFTANPNAKARDCHLLKMGRHFRLSSGAKMLLGRNLEDNEKIKANFETSDTLLEPTKASGPTALIIGSSSQSDIELVARIVATFSDHGGDEVEIEVKSDGEERLIVASPRERKEFDLMRI